MKSKDITFKGFKFTVSEDGATFRHPWFNKRGDPMKGRFVKFTTVAGGYLISNFRISGKRVYFYQHELVAFAFIGERPKGFDIDHIDGIRDHNNPENLRYVTHSENLRGYQKPRAGASSKYRGVSSHKGKWRARLFAKPTQTQIGTFTYETDAALAWNAAALAAGYSPEALNQIHATNDQNRTTELYELRKNNRRH